MVTDRGTGSYTMVVRAGKGFGRFPCPLGSVEPLNAVRGRIEGNFGRAGNVKVVLNAMRDSGIFAKQYYRYVLEFGTGLHGRLLLRVHHFWGNDSSVFVVGRRRT